MKHLVSVIVPVYNVGEYIEKCINSIINQTYSNLEILLINDGSTDNSPRICAEYAKKDIRIKLIHKENGGLSDARNVGLDVARGKYILFVDSDDYISEELVEILHSSMVKNRCDISTCQYEIFYAHSLPRVNMNKNVTKILLSEKALEDMLYQKNITNSAWGKLYKKSLFEDVRYPVGHNYEDLATTYKIFSKSDRIAVNNYIGYFYLQRSTSIMNSGFDKRRLDSLFYAKIQLNYVSKWHPDIVKAAENRVFMEALYILISLNKSNDNFQKVQEECKYLIRKYRLSVFMDTLSTNRARKYAACSFISINLLIGILVKNSNKVRRTK
jgi:glycosyltransferase involved in cell wall biosynthesis